MSFWTASSNFHPNLKNRFKITIGMQFGGADYIVFMAKSVDPLPSFSTEVIGGDMNQDGSNYDPYNKQSRVKWNPITITFVDVAYEEYEKNALYSFIQILYDAGYNPANALDVNVNNNSVTSILINNSDVSQLIGNVTIETLRPDGTTTSKYDLADPVITEMQIGGLDYGSDELNTFSLTFNYSYAKFTVAYSN